MRTKEDIKMCAKYYGMTQKEFIKKDKKIHPEEYGLSVKKRKMPKMKINRKQSYALLMKKMQSPGCSSEDAIAGAEAMLRKAKKLGITFEELEEQELKKILGK